MVGDTAAESMSKSWHIILNVLFLRYVHGDTPEGDKLAHDVLSKAKKDAHFFVLVVRDSAFARLPWL